jgi:hypothetical protein
MGDKKEKECEFDYSELEPMQAEDSIQQQKVCHGQYLASSDFTSLARLLSIRLQRQSMSCLKKNT